MILIELTIIVSIFIVSQSEAQLGPRTAPKTENLLQNPNGKAGLVPGNYPTYVIMNNLRVAKEINFSEKQSEEWKVSYKRLDAARISSTKELKEKHSSKLKELVRSKGTVDAESYEALESEVAQGQRAL